MIYRFWGTFERIPWVVERDVRHSWKSWSCWNDLAQCRIWPWTWIGKESQENPADILSPSGNCVKGWERSPAWPSEKWNPGRAYELYWRNPVSPFRWMIPSITGQREIMHEDSNLFHRQIWNSCRLWSTKQNNDWGYLKQECCFRKTDSPVLGDEESLDMEKLAMGIEWCMVKMGLALHEAFCLCRGRFKPYEKIHSTVKEKLWAGGRTGRGQSSDLLLYHLEETVAKKKVKGRFLLLHSRRAEPYKQVTCTSGQ